MRRTLLTGMVLFAGCSAPIEPEGWERVVGRVQPELSSIRAVLSPAEVFANVPFTVTVNTLGSSSCTREAGMKTRVTGRTAEITPYDLVAPAGTECTRDLHAFPRTVSIVLRTAGEGVIRVRGRGADGQPITFDFTVPVRN